MKSTETKSGMSPDFDPRDIEENKVVAAIGYIFILCLVPLLGKKDSAFAQFHGKQALVLTIAWFMIFVVGIIPILGWLVFFFGSIILTVLSVMGIINALAGKYWEIPVVSEYAKKIKL